MMAQRRLERVAAALALCALLAAPALAQITTGNVAGTVKDAQGGVVPGATVVLVSETKATKSAPAVTNAEGDYVFPNVTADTYTVEVTMEGFKTLTRKGCSGLIPVRGCCSRGQSPAPVLNWAYGLSEHPLPGSPMYRILAA